MEAENDNSSFTHFLNVDLDIYSKRDLQPLIKHFGPKVFVLYAGLDRGRYSAHLEVGSVFKTADATIRAFCRLVQALPEEQRSLWDAATVRSFSIGVQAGMEPNPCDFVIPWKTLKTVTELRAQIVLTIYPPEQARKRGSRPRRTQPSLKQ